MEDLIHFANLKDLWELEILILSSVQKNKHFKESLKTLYEFLFFMKESRLNEIS